MASFYCQELIRNTLLLCKSYIQRLLLEKSQKKGVLKDIDNEIGGMASDFEQDGDILSNRRVSYYVEENEKLLNLLITNCEPILSEIVG